ncbi:MAG TPA: ergothioneine biosynthesis protein EgtB [Rhizomicrobium sp.]|nr:ergothioneine biosynthesis protein EgtB [Rhizomicrobium sp.]
MNIHRRIAPSSPDGIGDTEPTLLERFRAVREATEALAAPLSAEDQNLQSMADASPVKWHRAHTTWFFETFVLAKVAGYRAFHPAFSYLFNSYYDAVGARHARPQRGLLSRPSAEEIAAYRRHADEAMFDLLAGGIDAETAALIALGLNHEEQHQELILTDILHAFGQNPLQPAYTEFRAARDTPPTELRFDHFDGGVVQIGHAGSGFAFDNESPRHETMLQPYRLADRLVSNGEWLEFMAAGGYRDPKYWLSDGWQSAIANGWNAPLYWEERDGQWFSMTLAGLRPLDLDAPVAHIGFYEADAFVRFRGKRLPTEAEWEHAASTLDPRAGNFRENGFLRPLPPRGSRQMFGDAWEWTASAYAPYPGYRAPAGAIGEYNGKFMVNQLVLRGGSCVTPRGHVRASYRNFFYPQQRWQFTGLRLAEDVQRRTRGLAKDQTASPFLSDVWEGLSRPQKQLKSKYFYDANGATLFEQICRLPEYYLTRTECALLGDLAAELAEHLAPGTALVEYGCGSCLKTRILLNRLPQISEYLPVDICGDSLSRTSAMLSSEYPLLGIRAVVGDFMQAITLPTELRSKPLLGFFPGSTIGNLTDAEAADFLARARETLGAKGKLLIGIDLVKDPAVLIAAYDDAAGVTAAFNKNVLAHINRELGGDFDLDRFDHRAVWNPAEHRIEMHLLSRADQTVAIGGEAFRLAAGETIHTENCHKYMLDGFARLADSAGWRIEKSWTSASPEFALLLLG